MRETEPSFSLNLPFYHGPGGVVWLIDFLVESILSFHKFIIFQFSYSAPFSSRKITTNIIMRTITLI